MTDTPAPAFVPPSGGSAARRAPADIGELREARSRTADLATDIVVFVQRDDPLDVFLAAFASATPAGAAVTFVHDAAGDAATGALARWLPIIGAGRPVDVVRNRHPYGRAAVLEKAAADLAGDCLVFVDASVVLREGWLPALRGPLLADPSVGAVSGALFDPRSGLARGAGIVFGRDSVRDAYAGATAAQIGERPLRVQGMDLRFAAVSRRHMAETADPAGDVLFGPGTYHDLDVCRRLAARGKALLVAPAARAADLAPGPLSREERHARMFRHAHGAAVSPDLWTFLAPALDRCRRQADPSCASGASVAGIDLCLRREDADLFWRELPRRSGLAPHVVRDLSYRVPQAGPISIPLALGADATRDPDRTLYLVDSASRLFPNSYFWQRRVRCSPLDLVVDLHGNAFLLRTLAETYGAE